MFAFQIVETPKINVFYLKLNHCWMRLLHDSPVWLRIDIAALVRIGDLCLGPFNLQSKIEIEQLILFKLKRQRKEEKIK